MTLTITLPADTEKFVEETLAQGRFLDAESLLVESVRRYAQEMSMLDGHMTPETIRAVREAADELDRDPTTAIPIETIAERFRRRGVMLNKLTA